MGNHKNMDNNSQPLSLADLVNLYTAMPDDWDNHEGWEKYYASLSASNFFEEDDEAFFDVDELYQHMQKLQEHHCHTIWFPGCGFSRLPKIFAECGFSVHATDISRTVIAFQQSVDVSQFKKQFQKLAHQDQSGYAPPLSNGTFECMMHDFRTPYLDDCFDAIFNIHAIQGFSEAAMARVAKVHHSSLKPGRTAYFFTMDVSGQRRDEIEECLVQSGFVVPRLGVEKWFQKALNDTGIADIVLVDGQPTLQKTWKYRLNKRKWQTDTARLESIFQEYQTKLHAAHENLPSDTKMAKVIYSTE